MAYAVIILNITRHDTDQSISNQYVAGIKSITEPLKSNFDTNIIVFHKNQIAILVNSHENISNNEMENEFIRYAELIYNNLADDLKSTAFISLSTVKDSVQELPAAYKECIEALNYKIAYGDSHFLQYSGIKGA